MNDGRSPFVLLNEIESRVILIFYYQDKKLSLLFTRHTVQLVPREVEDHQRAKLAEFRWNRALVQYQT